MKIAAPKRLRAEDFGSDDRDLINRLAYVINTFFDDVNKALSKNIDFTNLNRELITLSVKIDGSGLVMNKPQVKTSITGKPAGFNVLKASRTDTVGFPTSAPFVSFDFNGDIITITNITGLQANSEYNLTLELISSN